MARMKRIVTVKGLEKLEKNLDQTVKSLAGVDPAFVAVDRKIAPHAHWVEWGTVHRWGDKTVYIPAAKFFSQGITRGRRPAMRHIENELRKLIEGNLSDGGNIMLDAAEPLKTEITELAPMGHHRPQKLGKHVIYPGDLKKSIVAKKFGKRTKSGLFWKS